jgi:hypothetical protein
VLLSLPGCLTVDARKHLAALAFDLASSPVCCWDSVLSRHATDATL